MSSEKRTRGPNKQTPWKRRPEDGLSLLRLALDTSDPVQRARIEGMFGATYQVRRALQRDVRDGSRAYWAAHHERARNPSIITSAIRAGGTRSISFGDAIPRSPAAGAMRRT